MARPGISSAPRARWRRPPVRRAIAATAFVLVLAVAVGAAVATDGIGGLNLAVERASSWLSNATGGVGAWLPLGFAFTAGMVSAFNPCGFALLPAYLGLFLADQEGEVRSSRLGRLGRSLTVGGTVTAGFVLLFAVAGLILGLGVLALAAWMPWIGLTVGVLLVAAGGWQLAGKSIYTSAPDRLGARLGTKRRGVAGYFAFGLTYGLASLTCTMPIFLAVVGTTLTGATTLTSIGAFLLYGLGMGAVITTLTVVTGVFASTVSRRIRRVVRYIGAAGTVALFVAGAYVVYYWLTIGGLLAELT